MTNEQFLALSQGLGKVQGTVDAIRESQELQENRIRSLEQSRATAKWVLGLPFLCLTFFLRIFHRSKYD